MTFPSKDEKPMTSNEESLVNTASALVERLRKLGADTAEVSASSGWELSTRVRLGEVGKIKLKSFGGI